MSKTGTSKNSYLYAGEQYDESTKQYYLRARYYHPDLGRFMQMDTYQGRMGEPVTLHKYLYANGDPVNIIDPSGHVTIGETISAMDTAATLATVGFTSYNATLFATGRKELTAKEVGLTLLTAGGGLIGGKLLGLLGSKIDAIQFGIKNVTRLTKDEVFTGLRLAKKRNLKRKQA